MGTSSHHPDHIGLNKLITQYFTQTIQYLKTPNDVLSLYHQFKTIAKDNASQPIKEQNTLFTLFIQHYLQQRVSAIILTNQIDNELYNTFKDYLFINQLKHPNMWLKPKPYSNRPGEFDKYQFIESLILNDPVITCCVSLLQNHFSDGELVLESPNRIELDAFNTVTNDTTKKYINDYFSESETLVLPPQNENITHNENTSRSIHTFLNYSLSLLIAWGLSATLAQTITIGLTEVFHINLMSILDIYAPIRIISCLVLAPMTYYFLEHTQKNTDNISVNFSLRKALCVIGALVTFATVFSLINILPLTSHLSQYLLQNDVVSWTHFLILTGDTSPLVQLISFAMIGVFSLLNNLNNDSNTATASLVPTMIIGLFITYFAGLTPNLMMIPLPLTWVLTQCFMSYALPKPSTINIAYSSRDISVQTPKMAGLTNQFTAEANTSPSSTPGVQ